MTGKDDTCLTQKGSKTRPFNDPEVMRVVKACEICSYYHIDCDLCPEKAACLSEFDEGMERYTEHEHRNKNGMEKLRSALEKYSGNGR